MVRPAVFELGGGQIQQPFPGPGWGHLHKAQQILVGIPETHAPTHAGLEIGGRAGEVEGDHALIGVPDVDHAVGVGVRRLDLIDVQQGAPVGGQGLEGRIRRGRVQIALDDGQHRGLVDGLGAGRIKLGVLGVLVIAQDEGDPAALPRRQVQFDMMGPHRRPAVGLGVGRAARFHHRGRVPAPISPQEGFPVRVETSQCFGTGKVGKVIPPLSIFGFVIDDAPGLVHFHLARVEVALIVGLVVPGLPQGELHRGEEGEIRGFRPPVGHRGLPDLQVGVLGHKVAGLRLNALGFGADDRVAHAVAAPIAVQLGAGGLPTGRPIRATCVVPHIEVAPAAVHGDVVIAKAGQPAQAGVSIKRVAARRVGDQAKVGLAAQIVDPRQGRIRPGDHVF